MTETNMIAWFDESGKIVSVELIYDDERYQNWLKDSGCEFAKDIIEMGPETAKELASAAPAVKQATEEIKEVVEKQETKTIEEEEASNNTTTPQLPEDSEKNDEEVQTLTVDEKVCTECGQNVDGPGFITETGPLHLLCSGLSRKKWRRALKLTSRKQQPSWNRSLAVMTKAEQLKQGGNLMTGFSAKDGESRDFLLCKIGETHTECVSRLSESDKQWNCTQGNSRVEVTDDGKEIRLVPK